MPLSCANALRPDDRLVVLHRERGRRRHQLGRAIELRRLDADLIGQHVAARLDRHHHLFERGIARPLADAVDGALDLPRAGTHAGQRIGHRHAEIVVAVHREDRLLRARHLLHHRAEHLEIFLGRRIAHRIGQIDGGGAGLDRGLHAAAEVVDLGAGGVLGRPLHVVDPVARAAHLEVHHLQHLLGRLLQLVLAVHGRRGDERMDARPRACFTASPARSMSSSPARDSPHTTARLSRLAISDTAWKSPSDAIGKPGLDDVDAHLVEEVRHLQLLLERHGGAGALLAVTQSCIENENAVGVGGLALGLRRVSGCWDMGLVPYQSPRSQRRHSVGFWVLSCNPLSARPGMPGPSRLRGR